MIDAAHVPVEVILKINYIHSKVIKQMIKSRKFIHRHRVYLPYVIIKQLKSLDITLDFPMDNIVMWGFMLRKILMHLCQYKEDNQLLKKKKKKVSFWRVLVVQLRNRLKLKGSRILMTSTY